MISGNQTVDCAIVAAESMYIADNTHMLLLSPLRTFTMMAVNLYIGENVSIAWDRPAILSPLWPPATIPGSPLKPKQAPAGAATSDA